MGLLLARLAREATSGRIVLFDDREEKLSPLPSGLGRKYLSRYQDIPALSGTVYAVVTTETRRKVLEMGLDEQDLQKLRCPVGLPLGGKDPGSVAVSILAEILACHHGTLSSVQAALSA